MSPVPEKNVQIKMDVVVRQRREPLEVVRIDPHTCSRSSSSASPM